MKVERKQLRGNVIYHDFNNNYVGCPAGPVFLSSPKILKFKKITKESPKYYALRKYKNLCADSSRFKLLNDQDNYQRTRTEFVNKLENWQTPSDVDNMFTSTSNIQQGAAEQAKNIQKSKERTHSKVLSLRLPGMSGNMISDDYNESDDKIMDYAA